MNLERLIFRAASLVFATESLGLDTNQEIRMDSDLTGPPNVPQVNVQVALQNFENHNIDLQNGWHPFDILTKTKQ